MGLANKLHFLRGINCRVKLGTRKWYTTLVQKLEIRNNARWNNRICDGSPYDRDWTLYHRDGACAGEIERPTGNSAYARRRSWSARIFGASNRSNAWLSIDTGSVFVWEYLRPSNRKAP